MFFNFACSKCNNQIDVKESYVHLGFQVQPQLYHLGCYMDFRNAIDGFLGIASETGEVVEVEKRLTETSED